MKARKKPVEIEFITFDSLLEMTKSFVEDYLNPWVQRMEDSIRDNNDHWYNKIKYSSEKDVFYIKTLEGIMEMSRKDHLIIGVDGEPYPCKIDIFKKTYDIID